MENTILKCGICGEFLNFNMNTLETHPVTKNPSSEIKIGIDKDWYIYVVFTCFCQYDNEKIFKYYLTAEAYYELIRLLNKRLQIMTDKKFTISLFSIDSKRWIPSMSSSTKGGCLRWLTKVHETLQANWERNDGGIPLYRIRMTNDGSLKNSEYIYWKDEKIERRCPIC
ncbi:hypothetical protein LCGC14_1926960, partial [marine sediment metagenome]